MLPYPHARNDCGACRERDAEIELVQAEVGKRPPVDCSGCFGAFLAYMAAQHAGPTFDTPVTITVAPLRAITVDLLAGHGPQASAPATFWASKAGLAYPHVHNDCLDCHRHDADVLLLSDEGAPPLCGQCAGWRVAVRLADPATGGPYDVVAQLAPSRLQGQLSR